MVFFGESIVLLCANVITNGKKKKNGQKKWNRLIGHNFSHVTRTLFSYVNAYIISDKGIVQHQSNVFKTFFFILWNEFFSQWLIRLVILMTLSKMWLLLLAIYVLFAKPLLLSVQLVFQVQEKWSKLNHSTQL